MSASIEIEHQFPQLQSALQQYIELSNRSADEVLEKKGRDLGIRLFKKFRDVRWRGSRKGTSGIAWREFRRRARTGRGITLRPGIQPAVNATAMHFRKARRRGLNRYGGAVIPVKTSEHQKKVAAELSLRQAGIGVLGASFLWIRRRESRERGTYFVKNRTGRALGYVEKGDGSLRIVGLVHGLSVVDERYGILSSAVEEVTADTMEYVERKQREAFDAAMQEGGL